MLLIEWRILITLLLISPSAGSMCDQVQAMHLQASFDSFDDHLDPLNFSVCTAAGHSTCCTSRLEAKMLAAVQAQLKTVYHDRIIELKRKLDHHYLQFEGQYLQAIVSSRQQLHAMFIRTYGPFYQSHTQIFTKFFNDLQAFYTSNQRYQQRVKPILDEFFFDLFRTLLLILNPAEDIRDSDLDCLRSSFALQPFGDVPLKMERQLERSLGAARIFTGALKASTEILQSLVQREIPQSCAHSMMRVRYCSVCENVQQTIKPCRLDCLNAAAKCFPEYIIVEQSWQRFIDALIKLSNRLRGPYNVMAVVIPLAVQISESIMIFQEKAPTIITKIAKKCLRRDKEQIMERETTSFKPIQSPLPDFSDSVATSHSQLLSSFAEKMKETQNFWIDGPKVACIDQMFSNETAEMSCWNGTHVVLDESLGIDSQLMDPTGYLSADYTTNVFMNERLKLLMLSNQLLDSYDGRHLYNESADLEVSSGEPSPYLSTDDEDGDDGSGLELDDAPVVVDLIGSHRDLEKNQFVDEIVKATISTTTTMKTTTAQAQLTTVARKPAPGGSPRRSLVFGHILCIYFCYTVFRIVQIP